MKATLVRLFCLLISLAATSVGLLAQSTNLPPDLGLGTPPVGSNTALTPPVYTPPAVAETNAVPAKKKVSTKPKPVKLPGAFSGVVAAINTNALTITLAGPAPGRVLSMASQSHIFIKGKPTTFSQIKVGDRVTGQAKKTGKGPEVILNATFSAKAPGAKQAKKAKTPKKAAKKVSDPDTNATPPAK